MHRHTLYSRIFLFEFYLLSVSVHKLAFVFLLDFYSLPAIVSSSFVLFYLLSSSLMKSTGVNFDLSSFVCHLIYMLVQLHVINEIDWKKKCIKCVTAEETKKKFNSLRRSFCMGERSEKGKIKPKILIALCMLTAKKRRKKQSIKHDCRPCPYPVCDTVTEKSENFHLNTHCSHLSHCT